MYVRVYGRNIFYIQLMILKIIVRGYLRMLCSKKYLACSSQLITAAVCMRNCLFTKKKRYLVTVAVVSCLWEKGLNRSLTCRNTLSSVFWQEKNVSPKKGGKQQRQQQQTKSGSLQLSGHNNGGINSNYCGGGGGWEKEKCLFPNERLAVCLSD